jgi:hypothetical protein
MCYCRAALVFSVQNWLGESEDSKKKAATSGIFSVGMSGTSILSTQFISASQFLAICACVKTTTRPS